MVSRAQLIIVTVIVAFGLIGPMSFIAQEAARNTTTVGPSPTPPPQPVKLTQVRQYTAELTANIINVQPLMIVVLRTELPQNELIEALSNSSIANLTSLEPGQGVYTAVFSLISVESHKQLLVELSLEPVTVLDYGLPAEIELPFSFTAYRNGAPTEMTYGPSDQLDAIVKQTLAGDSQFGLSITQTGNVKKIVAVEIPNSNP